MNREPLNNLSHRVTLINPNTITLKDDIFTTGIVYVPIGLAYLSATLRDKGWATIVVDAFGEKPNQIWQEGNYLYRGLTPMEVLEKIPEESKAIFLYAINLTYHQALIKICSVLKKSKPHTPLIIVENTQAVTAYSLRKVQQEFYKAGADFVITGESEERARVLLEYLENNTQNPSLLLQKIDGIGFPINNEHSFEYSEPKNKIKDLDSLPFPAWDLFPLKNYWSLGYAHGPLSSSSYLPLLTSRGCPYKCKFCVIPETNDLKWRARSAKNVVDEIEFFKKQYGVTEFHIEDVDPTVNDKRTRELCQELIQRDTNINWKICSGTKVETLKDEETIKLMATSGCSYISISPESGSPKVMKLMDKAFDLAHAVKLVAVMNKYKIKSQACFVLGFPGEENEDLLLTKKMIHDMVKGGLDEIALFIITPVPGSKIYSDFNGYSNYSQLNFSPTWRKDYTHLNNFRIKLYRNFLIWKFIHWPFKILHQCLNFMIRRFETKMEMVPFRALHTWLLSKGIGGHILKTSAITEVNVVKCK